MPNFKCDTLESSRKRNDENEIHLFQQISLLGWVPTHVATGLGQLRSAAHTHFGQKCPEVTESLISCYAHVNLHIHEELWRKRGTDCQSCLDWAQKTIFVSICQPIFWFLITKAGVALTKRNFWRICYRPRYLICKANQIALKIPIGKLVQRQVISEAKSPEVTLIPAN